MKFQKILTEGEVTPQLKKILNILAKKGIDDADIISIWNFLEDDLYIDDYDLRKTATYLYHNYPDGDVTSYDEDELIDPDDYEKDQLALGYYLEIPPDFAVKEEYTHYGLSSYKDEMSGDEYAIGTEDEVEQAMRMYAEGRLDEIEIYGEDFIEQFLTIDETSVRYMVEDMAMNEVADMRDSEILDRSSYDMDEMESDVYDLGVKKDELEERETEILDEISDLEDVLYDEETDEDDKDEISTRIAELEDAVTANEEAVETTEMNISALESRMEDALEDAKEEVTEDLTDTYYSNVESDGVSYFTKGWGMELKDVIGTYFNIDEDQVIEHFKNEDPGEALNHYDGSYDEITYNDVEYTIFQTN